MMLVPLGQPAMLIMEYPEYLDCTEGVMKDPAQFGPLPMGSEEASAPKSVPAMAAAKAFLEDFGYECQEEDDGSLVAIVPQEGETSSSPGHTIVWTAEAGLMTVCTFLLLDAPQHLYPTYTRVAEAINATLAFGDFAFDSDEAMIQWSYIHLLGDQLPSEAQFSHLIQQGLAACKHFVELVENKVHADMVVTLNEARASGSWTGQDGQA